MSIENTHRSAKLPMLGGRRVSLVLAAPIVLLCGGLGVALGSIFPPHTWMSHGGEMHKASDEPAAVVAASASKDAQVPDEISETAQLENLPAPVTKNTKAGAGELVAQVPTSSTPRKSEKTDSRSAKAAHRWDREKRKRDVASHGSQRPERRGERNEPETRERSRPLISQIPVVGPVFGLFMP